MSHLRKWGLVLCTSLISSVSYSQEKEFIEADRPDQTEGVNFLSKNGIQVENGLNITQTTIENELALRYGLWEGTELRASLLSARHFSEMFTLSVKHSLLKGNQWLPSIAVYGYAKHSPEDKWFTDALIAFSNEISPQINLDYHVGTVSGFEGLNSFFLLGYEPSERWSFFIEYGVYYSRSAAPEHNVDLGFSYDITRDFQVDFILGDRDFYFGIKSLFFGAGLSYRIRCVNNRWLRANRS